MPDLLGDALLVLLGALLSRTWGHRQRLQRAHEQVALLRELPDEWVGIRQELAELAERDVRSYLAYRKPVFPALRMISRWQDVAIVGVAAVVYAESSLPGSEQVKGWVFTGGWFVMLIGVVGSLVVLVTRRSEVSAELKAPGGDRPARKRGTRGRRAES